VADAPKAYRIALGDTLDVIVWREDKISGPVQVRPDGMITVPLAGELKAAGLTPEELAKAVREALARFIDDPNVVVRVAAMGNRRFFVGNVRTPGMYELRPDQTFLQALAIAGGFTEFAARTHVRIVRIGAPPLEPDYDAIVKGKAQDLPLEPNDTIVVP
jgi:polysaccharide export outer membrane protein